MINHHNYYYVPVGGLLQSTCVIMLNLCHRIAECRAIPVVELFVISDLDVASVSHEIRRLCSFVLLRSLQNCDWVGMLQVFGVRKTEQVKGFPQCG